MVNFWLPLSARTRALPRTDRLSQRLENLLHLAVQTLLFRQRQSTGRSRTRLAKAKSNRSLASPRRQARGVCLPRCTLKAPAVTVCIPSAPVTPQLALRAGQNPAYPHSPSPWMERGPGGEVFFWLLFFSVSTGGPGTPVPGSQRQRQKKLRALRVFVAKKSLKSQPLRTNPHKFPSKFFPKIFPTAL